MYIYIYIHIYIHIYIYIYTHTHIYVYTYKFICLHVYILVDTNLFFSCFLFWQVYSLMSSSLFPSYISMIFYSPSCWRTRARTLSIVFDCNLSRFTRSPKKKKEITLHTKVFSHMHTCVYVCTCVCVHGYMYVCTHEYALLYIYVYVAHRYILRTPELSVQRIFGGESPQTS